MIFYVRLMIYRMIKQYSKFSSLIVWNLDRKSNKKYNMFNKFTKKIPECLIYWYMNEYNRMHREDNSRNTTANFSWVILADMDPFLTCDLKLISRVTNMLILKDSYEIPLLKLCYWVETYIYNVQVRLLLCFISICTDQRPRYRLNAWIH